MVLTDTRIQIDELDKQIMALLIERLEVVDKVAKLKKQHHIAPLDTNREQVIFDKISALNIDSTMQAALINIYTTLLTESKKRQQ